MVKYLVAFTFLLFGFAYGDDDFSELYMLETQGFENVENITSPLLTFNISGKSYEVVVVTVGQRDGRPYFPIFNLNKSNLKKFRDAFIEFDRKINSGGVIDNGKVVEDIVIDRWKLYTGDSNGILQNDNLTVSFSYLPVEGSSSYLVIEMQSDNSTVSKIRLDSYDSTNFQKAISEENIKIITEKARNKKVSKPSKSASRNDKSSKNVKVNTK